MYIYICWSVHITCQFLIYRVGPALPPPCHRHKCPPMGRVTVPVLYQGVLGRGLLCLEVPKASFLPEESLAPSESSAQPLGTGNCCSKAPAFASQHQGITASSSLPCLLEPASSCLVSHMLPALGSQSCPPSQNQQQAACGPARHGCSHSICSEVTCCWVQRVGLIPSVMQDGPSSVPPALDQPSICARGAAVPRP